MRHRGNRRQRLAAKPQRHNRREILGVPDLAGGVTFEGEPRVLRLHPFPVVLDAHLLLAAELDVDRQPARAGVDRVLDQLLDDGGWTLNHFTRGNLVGEVGWKPVDLHVQR